MKRKYMIIGFLISCLTAATFIGGTGSPSTASTQPYDPWMDINDDGAINIVDIVALGIRFDEEGTPINKTALLLELQSKIDSLNGTLEARIPKIGYISVSAAAFGPQNNTYTNFLQRGDSIYNYGEGYAYLYAPVQLPHGANITRLTSYYYNNGSLPFPCSLHRVNQTHNNMMAIAPAFSYSDYGNTTFTAIEHATVDKSKYAYYLFVYLPYSPSHVDYVFQYAIIEYEYPI